MRAADASIFILPGLADSGPEHWQSRWQSKLSTARRVEQRDFNAPMREEWVEAILRQTADYAKPLIFIAHSLGVIAFLHAAESLASRTAGAFLVAPPAPEEALKNPAIDPRFYPFPRAPLAFPSILVGSSADPYADLLFARALAADLKAQFIDAGPAGHINVESGHGPWPEGSIAFANFVAKL